MLSHQSSGSDVPCRQTQADFSDNRRDPRSKSNTAHAYADRFASEEETPMPPPERPSIKSSRVPSSSQMGSDLPRRDPSLYDRPPSRPTVNRATTSTGFEGPTQLRDASPIGRISRVPSESLTVRNQRQQLRPIRPPQEIEAPNEPSDESTLYSSPDRSYKERSASPATSQGSAPPSRTTSYSEFPSGKKPPPPPPPSRAKKPPPPPPPPMKRSTLSTANVSYA